MISHIAIANNRLRAHPFGAARVSTRVRKEKIRPPLSGNIARIKAPPRRSIRFNPGGTASRNHNRRSPTHTVNRSRSHINHRASQHDLAVTTAMTITPDKVVALAIRL